MAPERWLHRAGLRFRTLLHRRRVEEELESELQFHVEQQMALEIARGATHDEARRATLRALGGLEQVKEQCRDVRRMTLIEEIGRDALFAFRSLRQSPGFTAAAVLILALGIGMNATVFSLTSSVLFKGFPLVTRNDRLLYIGSNTSCCPSYPEFLDWKAQAKSFTGMALVLGKDVTFADRGRFPERRTVTYVTANAFQLAGVHPILGRDFAPPDESAGAVPTAILRYSFWEKRFGKDPGIVGHVVRLEGVPTTIVGVMPRGFSFPQNQDLWAPIIPTPDVMRRDNRDNWFAFGRLVDGVSIATARAEMATIGKRLEQEYPATSKGFPPLVQDFQQFFVGPSATRIYQTMWGAVGFVLLIVCANLASLLLARATGRAREISVRLALGAGRRRIVRQLMVESLMLSGCGGFCGWWLAKWGIRIYSASLNGSGLALGISGDWFDDVLDYSADFQVVVGYLIAISVATGLLFGLAPALRLSKLDANDARKEGGRGTTAGASARRWSALLVGTEVASAVVLLAGAGLMVRTFLHVYSGDLGFRTDKLTTAFFSLPRSRYAQPASRILFFDRLRESLSAIPGVESTALADVFPGGDAASLSYEIEGSPVADFSRQPKISRVVIGNAYFATLGLSLRAGRDFNESIDSPSGQPVAIVNHLFAARHWPGQTALGRRLRLFGRAGPGPWLAVVGIAPDVAQNAQREFAPVVYTPYRQIAYGSMRVLVRTAVPPGSIERAFRTAVRTIDPDLAIVSIQTLSDRYAPIYRYRGAIAALFLVFGAVAVVLASTGLYAVTAHSVSRRTQEIGIRMAIGATPKNIRGLVLRQGTAALWIGLLTGVAASAALNRVLKSVLVSVSPADPLTYSIVSVVLIAAAVLGCIVPARRAARVDPAIALRNE